MQKKNLKNSKVKIFKMQKRKNFKKTLSDNF